MQVRRCSSPKAHATVNWVSWVSLIISPVTYVYLDGLGGHTPVSCLWHEFLIPYHLLDLLATKVSSKWRISSESVLMEWWMDASYCTCIKYFSKYHDRVAINVASTSILWLSDNHEHSFGLWAMCPTSMSARTHTRVLKQKFSTQFNLRLFSCVCRHSKNNSGRFFRAMSWLDLLLVCFCIFAICLQS